MVGDVKVSVYFSYLEIVIIVTRFLYSVVRRREDALVIQGRELRTKNVRRDFLAFIRRSGSPHDAMCYEMRDNTRTHTHTRVQSSSPLAACFIFHLFPIWKCCGKRRCHMNATKTKHAAVRFHARTCFCVRIRFNGCSSTSSYGCWRCCGMESSTLTADRRERQSKIESHHAERLFRVVVGWNVYVVVQRTLSLGDETERREEKREEKKKRLELTWWTACFILSDGQLRNSRARFLTQPTAVCFSCPSKLIFALCHAATEQKIRADDRTEKSKKNRPLYHLRRLKRNMVP